MKQGTIIVTTRASLLAVFMVSGCVDSTRTTDHETSKVLNLSDYSVVPGARATIERKSDRLEFEVLTHGMPGAVYTVWMCGWDDPSACAATHCTREELEAEIGGAFCQYGGGAIADEASGRVMISGRSDVSSERVIGDGLDNIPGAEIHLVVRSHGVGLTGAELWAALTSFNGGCPPNTCIDEQAAIFIAPAQ
ncbi:hypothetical protein ENSA5_24850 [Enhygromyxa salina]|uniref:Lipoprotein n=1 Tax=Enhygromyxa salina TaxID=215803 RepID=A0A2S9YAX1_9BACT|nr:hypothetical protein [Enhygromyxa salina]PRQ02249.1 hypothetical protein ENSA5_24850 [Enhygromyxa salina]